jgi:hypothetical protein
LQVVNPSTEHRSWQATCASTEQVALHDALHFPSQEESDVDQHLSAQVVLQSPPHISLHCSGFNEPAQSFLQLPLHLSQQVPAQSTLALAAQPMLQSAVQSSRHVPVASAPQWPSQAAPKVASQTASKSMSEQRRGQSIFAVM